jgi:putative N6-adenine-specific DNA methylase
MPHKYFAVSARGIEPVTAAELEQLGAQAIRAVHGGVHFEGDIDLLYRASLWLRTASRILRPLREFAAQNYEMLYSQTRRVRWEDFLDASKTLAVQATIEGAAKRAAESAASSPPPSPPGRRERYRGKESNRKVPKRGIDHTMYAALKVKDAIVDRLRREQGSRPDVDKDNPDITVHAHFSAGRCTLSLDATGTSLHERGYRSKKAVAPLKETLAAAIIKLTGWDGHQPLFDPMCGSGTLVIEAAQQAMQIAPGLSRRTFGFQRWPEFDGKAWSKVVDAARKQKLSAPPCEIIASDVDPDAILTATDNARRAGLEDVIRFEVRKFEDATPPTSTPGIIVTNPPYGQRLGTNDELVPLYQKIGEILQTRFSGWRAYLMAGNLTLARHIGLTATDRTRLNNGPLECRLLKFAVP